MLKWILSGVGGGILSGLNALFGTIGKTIVDTRKTEAARQDSENKSGVQASGQLVQGYSDAGAQRADVQKSQGAWGPFGIAGFLIALPIAYYTDLIILDSVPWHIGLTSKWYVLPWLEWRQHVVGGWGIAALPGKLMDSYLRILEALFYVGPPSAALIVAAKAFRR